MVVVAREEPTLNIIALLLLAFAMATDAFAAAIGKGATLQRPRFTDALRMGILFGVIEAITPLIGWFLGQFASAYVEAWDHWIAFTLLAFLGLNMIKSGLSSHDDEETNKADKHSFLSLVLTAIATSIDSAAVGVSLAFVNVNIFAAAGLIGLATTIMVTLGVMIGRVVGNLVGHRAELLGGATLIVIGLWILGEHTGVITSAML